MIQESFEQLWSYSRLTYLALFHLGPVPDFDENALDYGSWASSWPSLNIYVIFSL